MINRVIFLIILLMGILEAVDTEDNLLKNASFEEGIPHWEAGNQNGIFISNDSFIGNKAVEYTTGGASQTTDIILDINGSINYIFSGYYKNIGLVDGMWLGIAYLDEDWNSIGSASMSLKPSMEYKRFALVDSPPIGTKYLSIWTWSETSENGKTLLDGLELYREGVEPLNHSPQIEPIAQQEAILDDNIDISINASDIDGDILTYYLKDSLNDEIYIDSQEGHIRGVISTKGTYTLEVFVIDGKGGVSERSFNLKIVSAPISECNILQNPSFENGLNNWSIYSANTTLVDDPHEGLKALRIRDGGVDQLSQEITTDIDTYQFNGYYKVSGELEGLWLGMNFYDSEKNLLFSKTIALQDAQEYTKFIVNATSTNSTKYIQAWIWSEGDGEITLDELKISRASCYNYTIASSLPPKGIAIENAPQFVVIGFDDNTKAEGIDWALDLFKDKKNADGSEARVSFYMNTIGLDEWIEDDPTPLLEAMKRLKDSSHEMGNHTYNHHSDLNSTDWDIYTQTISNLNLSQWSPRIEGATNSLINKVGLLREEVVGFRAPYLLYNNAMFQSLKANNFLYDCSIEDGYDSHFDGTNFRWPYQLDEGSPSHNENWYGNPENENFVPINSIKGVWELPNHVLMIPNDSKCKKYGIKKRLWKRMKTKIPYLSEHKITGFDYNIWSEAELNKAEFLGILKYNLDLRLEGNRAPFMLGAHTQYYTDEWADQNAPNATKEEMREVISEFVDYALSKPQVRIRPAVDIINWCNNPIPIN